MAPECTKCGKCSKDIVNKQFLKCSICTEPFHILCTTVSEARFYSFYAGSKDKTGSWKCRACMERRKAINEVSTSTPFALHTEAERESPNYVTDRKHKKLLQKSPSFDNLSQIINNNDMINSTLKDDSTYNSRSSLPNILTMENSLIVELKSQIEELTEELSIAHDEVAKLNIENSNQQKQLENLNKKIHVYTQLLNEDPVKKVGLNTPLRQSKITEDIMPHENKIRSLEHEITTLNGKIKTLQTKLSKTLRTSMKPKRKSDVQLSKEMTYSRIQHSTRTLQKTIKEMEERISKKIEDHNFESTRNSTSKLNFVAETMMTQPITSKPKMLLVSDFHGADLLLPLSKIRRNDYDATADIIYRGTVQRVLEDIQTKVMDYGRSDCLIIMCGGSDYNITPINQIMNGLEKAIKMCSHTNVIICDIPYSQDGHAEDYNNFVTKFNLTLKKRFFNFSNVWLQALNSVHFGIRDYHSNGYKLNYRGKFKLANCVNGVLISVNKAFYNSQNFLSTTKPHHAIPGQ